MKITRSKAIKATLETDANKYIYVIFKNGDPVAKGTYDAMIKKSYTYHMPVTIKKFPKDKLNSLMKMAKSASRPDPLKFAVNRYIQQNKEEYSSINASTSTKRKYTVKASSSPKKLIDDKIMDAVNIINDWVYKNEEDLLELLDDATNTYKFVYDYVLSDNTLDAQSIISDYHEELEYGGSWNPTDFLFNILHEIVGMSYDVTEKFFKENVSVKSSKSVTASEDGPLQVCRRCLLGIESHEGEQVVYDTIEYDDWDEDAEPLICDWCEDEADILYQITPDNVEGSTDRSAECVNGSKSVTAAVGYEVDVSESVYIDTMRDRFLNPEEFVFFFDGKEMYRGDGDGFSNVIADLCKDESTNQKFQDWCNQYGDPIDFDGTPKDTAYVFKLLVDQERMEQDDFYLDGSGILNFEMCDVSGTVESCADIKAAIGRKDETDDKEYYTALADGVVNAYTAYWNAEIGDMTDLTYEISDSAITFSDNGNVIYIQPLENITPNWDDLDSDIEELSNDVIGSNLAF